MSKRRKCPLECHISTSGKDHSDYMVKSPLTLSLLPCQRQDPFGILYFSPFPPFPRHKEVKPSRRGAAGGQREETSYKRQPCAPSERPEATVGLQLQPGFQSRGGQDEREGASQLAGNALEGKSLRTSPRCSYVRL